MRVQERGAHSDTELQRGSVRVAIQRNAACQVQESSKHGVCQHRRNALSHPSNRQQDMAHVVRATRILLVLVKVLAVVAVAAQDEVTAGVQTAGEHAPTAASWRQPYRRSV